MPLFRHLLNPAEAEIRPPAVEDRDAIQTLLGRANFQHSSLIDGELDLLLQAPLGALMWSEGALVAALLAGLAPQPVSWIRAIALDDRLRVSETLPLLLSALHHEAAARLLQQLYFVGDPWSSTWLQNHLRSIGYVAVEEVITCEKRSWSIPSYGNPAITVRPVSAADIPAVAAIDHAAFDLQWVKVPPILAEALHNSALFHLAEERDQILGYALVTEHYDGRLAHLVRLAVLPDRQGHGIGTRLLSDVVEFCRNRHTQTLSLNTQASNSTARRLYSWFGFEPTGDRQVVLRYDMA